MKLAKIEAWASNNDGEIFLAGQVQMFWSTFLTPEGNLAVGEAMQAICRRIMGPSFFAMLCSSYLNHAKILKA